MSLFSWLTKEDKKEIATCREIPEKEKTYALHVASREFLLKGGQVEVREDLKPWGPQQRTVLLRPVLLASAYGANSQNLLVTSLSDVTLVDGTVGHSSVLALDGSSINMQYLSLNQIQALAIIEDLGVDHEVSARILMASFRNFERAFKRRTEEAYLEVSHRHTEYAKTYLFCATPEMLYKTFQLQAEEAKIL